MDATRFDALLRALSMAPSRRGVARAVLGLAMAGPFAGLAGVGVVDAKKKHKKKKRKKKKRTACVPQCGSKECGDNGCGGSCGNCGGDETCEDGACVAVATCSDGQKNGSETDIDCGGSCPRCGDGKGCASRNDCVSAVCHAALYTCQACGPQDTPCGDDADGVCICDVVNGQQVCDKNVQEGAVSTCQECPTGTHCVDFGSGPLCFKPCGAP